MEFKIGTLFQMSPKGLKYRLQVFLNAVQVAVHILSFIPAPHDLPSQSYIVAQLAFNYLIISIISKTKGPTKKFALQSCSAHRNTSFKLYPSSLRPS